MSLIAPEFIDIDLDTHLAEAVATYEAATGKTLVPTDVEYLILQSLAYRETLLRAAIQSAAEQNLVDFATNSVLDYLADLVGVERLSSSSATCTLKFTLVGGHGAVIIPAGTRVKSTDGLVTFQTLADESISALIDEVELTGEALTPGTGSNGYSLGSISVLIDALAFVSTVENIDIPAGGSETESDESLRVRIKLAPSIFSTAGSRDAYKFHALSANSNLIDVAVLGPPSTTPGTVEIYPLMEDGTTTPAQILAAVENAVSGEKVRPLTDTVIVSAPTIVNYDIEVELIAFVNFDQTDLIDTVTDNLSAFVLAKRQTLGKDITESQVIRECQIYGVYSVSLVGWSDIIVGDTEYPLNGTITVTITSTTTG